MGRLKYPSVPRLTMDCPCCGRKIRPAEEVLAGLDALYMACPLCPPEPGLEKNSPLHLLDRDLERCSACSRAPLDLVMLEVLEVLVDFGLRDRSDTLRSVGSPLVEIGYPMAYPPRLGRDELIISGRGLSRPAAEEITKSVPEVKGVIQGDGLPGMIDPGRGENDPELLAGCDLRCDVVQSIFGDLVIYKNQSKVHIEFSRQDAPKMRILEDLCLRRRVRDVADCLCGPGTLGLICLLAGATRVVLNDIWRPAVENAILNLEVNRSALGIGRVDRPEPSASDRGSYPVLVGLVEGEPRVEVYHGDLARLFSRAKPAEICLIDPFPGGKTKDLIDACRSCGDVVVI